MGDFAPFLKGAYLKCNLFLVFLRLVYGGLESTIFPYGGENEKTEVFGTVPPGRNPSFVRSGSGGCTAVF